MKLKKETQLFFLLGIISFLLIESFYNLVLYANTAIFVKYIHNLELVIPWIIVCLFIIFGEIILFSNNKLESNLKLRLLVYITISQRILIQFKFPTELLLVFSVALFITLILYFTEILFLFKRLTFFTDFRQIIGGLILGMGIQTLFLILSISSNLSTNIIKLPAIIISSIILIFLNNRLFSSYRIGGTLIKSEETNNLLVNNENFSLVHFLFFGLVFYFCLNWIINPMILAAYDKNVQNFISYGYIFYGISILIFSILSFFLISVLFHRNINNFSNLIIIINLIYLILNSIIIFIIDMEFLDLAPLYISIITFVGIFCIMLNISYYLSCYNLPSRSKTYKGIALFLISFICLFAIQTIISWVFYFSYIYMVFIMTMCYFLIFMFLELKKIRRTKTLKSKSFKLNKLYALTFTILLGINLIVLIPVVFFRKIEAPNKHPTIMVWNIHNAIGMDGQFDLDRIIDEIREYDPDIIGINEIDNGAMKSSYMDMTAYLAHKLNMYYYFGPSFYNHYGNAILSKYELSECNNYRLPRKEGTYGEPRGVICVKIIIDKETWIIYNTHLNEPDAIVQIPYIVELIESDDFKNIVWMGDFNAIPNSEEYKRINDTTTLKFIDTHKYLENNPDLTCEYDEDYNPTKRIDYILCSPDLIPLKSYVHCSIASDHCAVITRF